MLSVLDLLILLLQLQLCVGKTILIYIILILDLALLGERRKNLLVLFL